MGSMVDQGSKVGWLHGDPVTSLKTHVCGAWCERRVMEKLNICCQLPNVRSSSVLSKGAGVETLRWELSVDVAGREVWLF